MEKLAELRKTLNFYVCSNELKNKIIDEPNNYSVADNLFGSMILATAIDSEFKETSNLSKIYRMLLLSEFSILYPNYDFENLKLGKYILKELVTNGNHILDINEYEVILEYKDQYTPIITKTFTILKSYLFVSIFHLDIMP